VDPSRPSVATLADFLVFLHDVRNLAPSTIASYRSSLAGVLGSVDGVPLGHHPALSQLIRSLSVARPPRRPVVPAWDLATVLLSLAELPLPTSWIARSDRLAFTCKLAFLLALATGKRRSELQALSRDPRDLRFTDQGVWLRTVPGFLPKVAIPGHDPAAFFVPTLVPDPSSTERDLRLCPVTCLRLYLRLTGGLKDDTRLLQKVRGSGPPSAQSVSRWIVQCIQDNHQEVPGAAHAHEVRRMAASWAFQAGHHSMEDILMAGWWSSPVTFTRFYLAHLHPQPDGRFRLTPVVAGRQIPVG